MDSNNQELSEEAHEINETIPLIMLPNDSFVKIKNGNMKIIGETFKDINKYRNIIK